ncbi:MAG: sugar ABC transporter substrate-binding protein [Herbiconiux sp.]|nr:sugar ABC transporter substrate-binding protein [Herbiconiux sp.]
MRSQHSRGIRRALAITASAGLLASLAACSSGGPGSTDSAGGASGSGSGDCNVGISMPTRSLERWINDGEGLQKLLEEQGCTADLQYADNKTDQQISQLQNQIAGGANILVITAIDGDTLGPVLAEAEKQDVTVIAYDRLINGSDAIDYHTGFDNEKVGELQANYIVDTLDLESGAGPFTFEPFAGSPDDNNARYFFSGAWDVLLPYVENGQLTVPSGKAPKSNDDWASIGILGWGSDDAQAEMENRLSSFYTGDQKVDVVLSPNDSLALGIEAALKGAGYTAGEGWPIVTGQDADKANVQAILNDQQAMTVWKDTRVLRERTAEMIASIVAGEEPETTTEFDNGATTVKSYELDPEVVVKDDVQTKLIDSGFLKASDVGL